MQRALLGLGARDAAAPTLDVGSFAGTAALALGYVLFVAFVTLLAALALSGREQYRNGQLRFEPVRCMILATVVLLIAASVLHALSEVLSQGGAWGLSFELADQRRAGSYQGVFSMTFAVASMVGWATSREPDLEGS